MIKAAISPISTTMIGIKTITQASSLKAMPLSHKLSQLQQHGILSYCHL